MHSVSIARSLHTNRYSRMRRKTSKKSNVPHDRALRPSELWMRLQNDFHLRTSLFNNVNKDLSEKRRTMFYQRVIILAKNVLTEHQLRKLNLYSEIQALTATVAEPEHIEVDESEEDDSDIDPTFSDSEKKLAVKDKKAQWQKNLVQDTAAQKEISQQTRVAGSLRRMSSIEVDHIEKLIEKDKTADQEGAEGEDGQADVKEAHVDSDSEDEAMGGAGYKQRPFMVRLQEKIAEVMNREWFYSQDRLSGCFINMGEYSLMVLEATEDILSIFFIGIKLLFDEFFSNCKIFSVEDNIDKLYFNSMPMIYRRAGTINANEKFDPATPNDPELMRKQQRKLIVKIHAFCEKLGDAMKEKDPRVMAKYLPPTEYNRLLPEMQRIELVLTSKRFYRTIPEFARIYAKIPIWKDDDAMSWPVSFNYVPVDLFKTTKYDVNLTFREYVERKRATMSRLSTVKFELIAKPKEEDKVDAISEGKKAEGESKQVGAEDQRGSVADADAEKKAKKGVEILPLPEVIEIPGKETA